MLDRRQLQTVAEALHLMHEMAAEPDYSPAEVETIQEWVREAWHALALPGEPWES
jgi:hypothetical protein